MSLPVLWPIRKSLRKLKEFMQYGKNIIYRAAEGANASWSQTYSSLLLQSLNKYKEMYFSCCWAVLLPLHCAFELSKTVNPLFPYCLPVLEAVSGLWPSAGHWQQGGQEMSIVLGVPGGNKDREHKDWEGIYIWFSSKDKGEGENRKEAASGGEHLGLDIP